MSLGASTWRPWLLSCRCLLISLSLLLSIAPLDHYAFHHASTSNRTNLTAPPSTTFAASGHANRSDLSSSDVHPNQLIIGVDHTATAESIREQMAAHGLTLLRYWPELDAALVQTSAFQKDQSIGAILAVAHSTNHESRSTNRAEPAFLHLQTLRQQLESSIEFRYVSYNNVIQAADITEITHPPAVAPNPTDPDFLEQWAFEPMQVVRAWDITQGDPDVIVAVLDSGYDMNHPDLSVATRWSNGAEAAGKAGVDDDGNGYVDDFFGWDWVEDDNDVSSDPYGHGTHVGGMITAVANNNIGIAGVGANIKILPLRILNQLGNGQTSTLVDALLYAKNAGARIVNLSLVLKIDNPLLADAINLFADEMLIICAAGNGHKNVFWPAAYDGTVAVSATDQPDIYSGFSNYGPEIDIAAPGIGIVGTSNNSRYRRRSGTSMASAHVSALAGLLLSLRPDFSNDDILATIQQTALDINVETHPGVDEYIGHGRIDFYDALLDASKGIQILAPNGNDLFNFASELATYGIWVTTPSLATLGDETNASRQPIAGATVHHTLFTNSGDAVPDSSGWRLTNQDGAAQLELLIPEQVGTYVIQVQVGQVVTYFPVLVFEPPASVNIESDSTTLQVGEGKTKLVIEARDERGELITDPLPFLLQTSAGKFVNGQQSIRARLDKGRYAINYYAPDTVGTVDIEMFLGDGDPSETVQITIESATGTALLPEPDTDSEPPQAADIPTSSPIPPIAFSPVVAEDPADASSDPAISDPDFVEENGLGALFLPLIDVAAQ